MTNWKDPGLQAEANWKNAGSIVAKEDGVEVRERQGDGNLGAPVVYARPVIPTSVPAARLSPFVSPPANYQAMPPHAPPPYNLKYPCPGLYDLSASGEFLVRFYANDKFIGDTWLGMQSPMDASNIVANWWAAMHSGKPFLVQANSKSPILYLPGMYMRIEVWVWNVAQWCLAWALADGVGLR